MLEFIDGIDRYGTTVAKMLNGAWAAASCTIQSSVVPPNCSYALQFTQNQKCRRVLPTPRVTCGMGFRYYTASLPGYGHGIMYWADVSGNCHVFLYVNASGGIEVWRSGTNAISNNNLFTGAVQLGVSANGIILAATWQHIEAKAVINNSTGSVEVRVEGVTVLTVTGADTQNGSTGTVSNVGSFYFSTSGNPTYYIRDWFCWNDTAPDNDDFIGIKRVYPLKPTADTAQNDWLPNTGSDAYAVIDEVPDNDGTDYLYGSAGDISEFTLEDLPVGVGGIVGVSVDGKLAKSDAGVATMKLGLNYNGMVAEGDAQTPGTSYAFYSSIFEVDPYGSAWTRTVVNATKLRVNRET